MKVKRVLTTIDTHTAGGPTRTVIAGLPPLQGESVAAKMEYFRTHFVTATTNSCPGRLAPSCDRSGGDHQGSGTPCTIEGIC